MRQKIYLEELPKSFFRTSQDVGAFDPTSFVETSTPIHKCKLKINSLPLRGAKHRFTIKIGREMHALKCAFALGNTVIELGNKLTGSLRVSCWHGSSLKIGDHTSMSEMRVVVDRNSSCIIGSDCLISDGVLLQIGDQHAIFDIKTRELINNNLSTLSIGDHVWLGRDSSILASSELSIGSSSIVGLGSLVTKTMPAASLIVGSPAKVLRQNVSWHRSRSPDLRQIDDVVTKYICQ